MNGTNQCNPLCPSNTDIQIERRGGESPSWFYIRERVVH